jgi:hypothetical protein
MFDPKQGRFLTRDPMGYIDGMGLKAFVEGNPENFDDPLGLATFRDYRKMQKDFIDKITKGDPKKKLDKNFLLQQVKNIYTNWLDTLLSDATRRKSFAYWYKKDSANICGNLFDRFAKFALSQGIPIFRGGYNDVPHGFPTIFIGDDFTPAQMSEADNWVTINVGTLTDPEIIASLTQEDIDRMLQDPTKKAIIVNPQIKFASEFGEGRAIVNEEPFDSPVHGITQTVFEIQFTYGPGGKIIGDVIRNDL